MDNETFIANLGTKIGIALALVLPVLLAVWVCTRRKYHRVHSAGEIGHASLFLDLFFALTIVGFFELGIAWEVYGYEDVSWWSGGSPLVWLVGQMFVLAAAGNPFTQRIGRLSVGVIPAGMSLLSCIVFIAIFFGYLDTVSLGFIYPYTAICVLIVAIKPRPQLP